MVGCAPVAGASAVRVCLLVRRACLGGRWVERRRRRRADWARIRAGIKFFCV